MYISAVVLHLALCALAPKSLENSFNQAVSPKPASVLLASGDDSRGPDPHGADPHDEQHDQGLPSQQKDYNDRQNRQDPYGGQAPKGPNGGS